MKFVEIFWNYFGGYWFVFLFINHQMSSSPKQLCPEASLKIDHTGRRHPTGRGGTHRRMSPLPVKVGRLRSLVEFPQELWWRNCLILFCQEFKVQTQFISCINQWEINKLWIYKALLKQLKYIWAFGKF